MRKRERVQEEKGRYLQRGVVGRIDNGLVDFDAVAIDYQHILKDHSFHVHEGK